MAKPFTADHLMTLAPVIPVLVLDSATRAANVAHALVQGGLAALEVTLRTEAALDVIREMASVAGAFVGAGTVLNAKQMDEAQHAGAKFIVSPGLTKPLVKAAQSAGIPLLAGIATAGDIMRGLDLGLDRFKFFPAETSGGAAAIKAFAGPFANLMFCPTGGISPNNADTYLTLPNVACVGGSWLAPPALVEARDWARIETLARDASKLGRTQ